MKQKSAMGSIMKGIAAGAVVGTATYMMSTANHNHAKNNATKMKKTASKAMKAVGTVIENVAYLMK